MLRVKALAVTYVLLSLEVMAYPVINIPYLSATARYKKNDLGFPVVHADMGTVSDGDVLELEHLKRNNGDQEIVEKFLKKQQVHEMEVETLPEFQSELEVALPTTDSILSSAPITTQITTTATATTSVKTEIGKNALHHSPVMPSSEQKSSAQATAKAQENMATENGQAVPSMAKPFYGAARLAFGQNPELLPTSSTTSTTSTTITSTSNTNIMPPTASASNIKFENTTISATKTADTINNDNKNDSAQKNIKNDFSETVIPVIDVNNDENKRDIEEGAEKEEINKATKLSNIQQQKETIGDVVVDELETVKKAVRRSMNQIILPKTAKSLLHHRDGQYSSFDMAQYIFWTGDETGVAHAVEECIEQGLMSRENALKFLRDIRMGIEYLQRSYENRVLPENIHQNSVKKSYPSPLITTTSTTTTTNNPLRNIQHAENSAQNSAQLIKTLDSIALWNKLQELNADNRQDLTEYDEATGRAKIAEFLYTHYTVEDILYKLAKVMFTQSLAHGSDEAQRELQKLTDFLEREGNLGVIPIDLQKKVLHVLLTALSDTLTEHPELLPAARENLINPYERLPLRTYGIIN